MIASTKRAVPLAGLVAIDDVRLYREVRGAGHPLVLLHAGIADGRMWDQQITAFAERFMVIRYDARGFGQSASARGEFSPRADLVALLAAHGIARAHLLGLSMGGAVALDLAITNPDLVSALVMASTRPSGLAPSEALRDQWKEVDTVLETGDVTRANEMELRMWVDGPHRPPDHVDPAVRRRVSEMNRALLKAPDEGTPIPLDPPAVDRLGDVRAPSLVLFGDQDQPDVIIGSERIAGETPGARSAIIANAAHMINMEQPAEFNRLVLDFLTDCA